VARLFVSERRGGEGIDWASLRAVDVTGFTTRDCRGRGVSSARQVVAALHCLRRYVRLEGVTGLALDDTVLSVTEGNPSLPRGINPAEVKATVGLLRSPRVHRAPGLRDRDAAVPTRTARRGGGEPPPRRHRLASRKDCRDRQGRRAGPPAACCRRRSGAGGLPAPGPTQGQEPGRLHAPGHPDLLA
jgi:hypothetical protein